MANREQHAGSSAGAGQEEHGLDELLSALQALGHEPSPEVREYIRAVLANGTGPASTGLPRPR